MTSPLLGYLSGSAASRGLSLRTVVDETVALWERAGVYTQERRAQVAEVETWLSAHPDHHSGPRPTSSRPNHPGMTAVARVVWDRYSYPDDTARLEALREVLTAHGYGVHEFGGTV